MSGSQADHFPRRLWWVLAGLTLVWGLNWVAMKAALSEVPPWTFRALCLSCGSLVLIGASRAAGERLVRPQGRSQWARLALVAFLNITMWNILVAFGLRLIPAGRGAILGYMMPALAVPLSIWLLGERPTPRRLIGLALGICATVLLLGEALLGIGQAPTGSFMILGAAASWALGSVMQKRYPVNIPVASYTAWVMILGGLPILPAALLFEHPTALGSVGFWAWLGVAYNVFLAFGWAHWAWFKISTEVPVTIYAISMPLVPLLSVLSGMLVLGERPSWAEYTALLLVAASMITVLSPRAARE